jgi:C1A family cysteine protease
MIAARKVQRYGWQPDSLDHRDLIFYEDSTTYAPASVDLTAEMPPVYDQLQLGSCTANAVAGLMEHQAMKEHGAAVTPSRLFIYYEERRIEGQPPGQDTGAEIRDGIKVVVTEGAPPETEWPYSDANPGPFQQMPPAKAYADAQANEALIYRRIIPGSPGSPMRTALVNHLPITFGFTVPSYFESAAWDPVTQYLGIPGPTDKPIGGHAVVIVGYDYTLTRFSVPVFKVRNSWGAGWGDNGHYYMDTHWCDSWRNLTSDFWVISKTT